MTISAGHRFEATQALRQVLNRAVEWKMIDVNPAKHGVDNPQRRRTEKRPFESWAQLAKVASWLGDCERALVLFAAATGLRPGEWIALEQRDIDREARVVYVRRAFRNGRIKCPKTEGSVRVVPLQAIALDALEQLPAGQARTFCFHHCAAPTSISTTSVPGSGSPPNSQPGSHRSAAFTIFGTRSRPSRCVPASQPSTCLATWVPA